MRSWLVSLSQVSSSGRAAPSLLTVRGWLVPKPEVFARHAVSTLGVAHHTTGYWLHTLQVGSRESTLVTWCGLHQWRWTILIYAKNNHFTYHYVWSEYYNLVDEWDDQRPQFNFNAPHFVRLSVVYWILCFVLFQHGFMSYIPGWIWLLGSQCCWVLQDLLLFRFCHPSFFLSEHWICNVQIKIILCNGELLTANFISPVDNVCYWLNNRCDHFLQCVDVTPLSSIYSYYVETWSESNPL